ncbi:MAG: adenylyltransferase/cytidyltransferase family protein [Nanoarchaeota archaeon]
MRNREVSAQPKIFPSGLFIGRFQPLHNGHVDAVCQALTRCKRLIMILGSANVQNEKNPYSLTQRKHMLNAVFRKEMRAGRITVVPVLDYPRHREWINTVINAAGDFQVVFTRNRLTRSIFLKKGYAVFMLKKNIDVHSTRIRDLMRHKNPAWKTYVPSALHHLLAENNTKRILKPKTMAATSARVSARY